jgi:hypothetical protein
MGTFAETATAACSLSFADQGKQTSVFRFYLQQTTEIYHFRLPFAENKRKLPFSVISVFSFAKFRKHGDMEIETWKHGDIDMRHVNMDMDTWTWTHGHGHMDMDTWTWTHVQGHMDMDTWTWTHGHGHIDMDTWTWTHGHGHMAWAHEHGHMDMDTLTNLDMLTWN